MSHLDQPMDLGDRVRWFIRGNYRGGGTVKRLSREFDWSLSKAKRVFNGEGIRRDDLELMAKRWGWRFVEFVFAPVVGVGGDVIAEHRRTAQHLARDWARGPFHVGPAGMDRDRAAAADRPADGGRGGVAGASAAPAPAFEVKKAAK